MTTRPGVWVDFENAPHVWVFSRLIPRLEARGVPIFLTARDFSCTVDLCHRLGFEATVVGPSGPAKSRVRKAWRVMRRAFNLTRVAGRAGITLKVALSHGSRSQILAGKRLGLRVVSLDDYEHSDQSLVRFVDDLLVPFPIPVETWGRQANKVLHYPGLKESLYLCDFSPDLRGLERLNEAGGAIVVFRPEGTTTHYRSAQTSKTEAAILASLARAEGVFVVVLPRDSQQAAEVGGRCATLDIRYWIPGSAVDGPTLLWASDLVIGGGGTMTREAAALGVPACSYFGGPWGAVDRYLKEEGRLTRIADASDAIALTVVSRRQRNSQVSAEALGFVERFVAGVLERGN